MYTPVCESVVVSLRKDKIEFDLAGYPSVEVVGSRMTEEGWELVLLGDGAEVDALLVEWEEVGALYGHS